MAISYGYDTCINGAYWIPIHPVTEWTFDCIASEDNLIAFFEAMRSNKPVIQYRGHDCYLTMMMPYGFNNDVGIIRITLRPKGSKK
jgi:hypothetical protein